MERYAIESLLSWIQFESDQEEEIARVDYSAIRELNYKPLILN